MADHGYKLLSHIMIPYSIYPGMPQDEADLNYLHSRTRITVEMAFGLWKNRFRVFKAALNWQKPEMMAKPIESTIILHNWLIYLEDDQEEVDLEDWMLIGSRSLNDDAGLMVGEDAKYCRDLYKEYFTNNKL